MSTSQRKSQQQTVQKQKQWPFGKGQVPPPPTNNLDDAPLIPDSNASFLSLLTYHWIQPLISLGNKRTVEQEDLWKLDPSREAEHIASELLKNFDTRSQHANAHNDALDSGQLAPSKSRKLWWKIKSRYSKSQSPDGHVKPSLALALSDTFFVRFWSAGLLKVISDTLQVTTPLVTKELINFAGDSYLYHRNYTTQAPNLGRGIGLAVGVVLMQLVSIFCLHHFFSRSASTGVLARGALISAIYRRALKFSGKSRAQIPNGKLTAHIGPDVSRIDFCAGFFHMIWAAPIQIIICVIILLINIKQYALPGIALFLIAAPLQTRLMKFMFGIRTKVMIWTDKRVKLTQEIIGGMRILKLFSWEVPYLQKLTHFRKNEMSLMRKLIIMRGLNMAVALSIPMLATVLAFSSYALSGHDRDPALIFTAFTLFNILRQPLMMFPLAASTTADAKNALNRIYDVFVAETIDEPYEIDPNLKDAVYINDASFVWESSLDTNKQKPTTKKPTAAVMGQQQPEKTLGKRSVSTLLHKLKPRWRFHKKEKKVVENNNHDDYKQNHAKENNNQQQEEENDQKQQQLYDSQQSSLVDSRNETLNGGEVTDISEKATSEEMQKAQLQNICMKVPRGQLCAIIGPVGSGKSSLLQALVGEMKRIHGQVKVSGTIGYCPQQAWIQNTTLRENITFGKPFDEEKYWNVIHDACLTADLEILPNGDFTQIGEKGITLSGGQKQRVNIARALYFGADIVALDDPLSAVDAHVGEHLFKYAIKDSLAGKTRLLVTHALHVLHDVDHIIIVANGKIEGQGTYDELMATNESFSELLRDFGGHQDEPNPSESKHESNDEKKDKKKDSTNNERPGTPGASQALQTTNKKKHNLMQEEERSTGTIPVRTYVRFIRGAGFHYALLLILSLTTFVGSTSVGAYTLTWWQQDTFSWSQNTYMGLYAGLGVGQAIFMFCVGVSISFFAYNNSRNIHQQSIKRLLFAPMSFFDTTPMGRIMNRFSKDIDTVDNQLNDTMRMFLTTFASTIGSVVLIAIVEPYFLIAVAVLGILYTYAARYYFSSAREVKRLDNVLRSGLYAHFSESMGGLGTIRAYGVSHEFAKQNEYFMDLENRAYYLTVFNQRWLGLRLDLCGIGLLIAVVVIVITQRNSINPSQIGLILSYTLMIQQTISWMIRQLADFQNNLNSVERMFFYADEIEQEAPQEIQETLPDPAWPEHGEIDFENVEMKYRPELPPVLHGINLHIKAGERIGIVGRTGAGKSSISQVLFRLVELSAGKASIDGVDISKIGLSRLRSSIAMIPQDPLLFSGTLRTNLDPFDEHDDATLWDALRRAWLVDDSNENSRFKLDMKVDDEGANLSVGERSLVSLARALVRDSRIVMLDEATSSVDIATDNKIQETIRTEFKNTTMLTIAHRLRTIISYDRVLVMHEGKVAEFDTPLNLFNNADGIFHSLCVGSDITIAEIENANEHKVSSL